MCAGRQIFEKLRVVGIYKYVYICTFLFRCEIGVITTNRPILPWRGKLSIDTFPWKTAVN